MRKKSDLLFTLEPRDYRKGELMSKIGYYKLYYLLKRHNKPEKSTNYIFTYPIINSIITLPQ